LSEPRNTKRFKKPIAKIRFRRKLVNRGPVPEHNQDSMRLEKKQWRLVPERHKVLIFLGFADTLRIHTLFSYFAHLNIFIARLFVQSFHLYRAIFYRKHSNNAGNSRILDEKLPYFAVSLPYKIIPE
jgi:hypothetical protein